ncbi:MAG: MOSC domain-containing protein [Synechococcaceae cyanobacterium SM2_3_2]|nr:MOSC domain-containing protein [Synechococcaceae cyanobacterium SM2_3_2]
MAEVARLLLYPIKSLDPMAVEQATLTAGGSFRHDRAYQLVDEQGQVINGKRTAQIHQIRTDWDPDGYQMTLTAPNAPLLQADLRLDREPVEAWFSSVLGQTVRLQENRIQGFPDDLLSPGPTVISTSTLEAVSAWFDGIPVDQMRLRLRMNIELGAISAFWEDTLFGSAGTVIHFRIGSVDLYGINPCARCIVPTRDPVTGEALKGFQRQFAAARRQTMPAWAEGSRFDHFYRLGVNTIVPAPEENAPEENAPEENAPEETNVIRVGDPVEIVGPAPLNPQSNSNS